MRLSLSLFLALVVAGASSKEEDLVTTLPGFANSTWPFKVYSGLLDVPGPINGYDSLKIHYQFHTSQSNPQQDPVMTWHQGGPGGSSIAVGLYGEMGAFIIGEKGNYPNPWAWNKLANMLYLESPAGSGSSAGYSMCIKAGTPVSCKWDDVSQAEAYAHTLLAFFKAFPDLSKNSLYLSGESYFGQYGPNIAHFIVSTEPFKSSLNLKGIALGNACWGGNSTCVACNGPSEDKLDVDFFFGRAMYSPKLHDQIYKKCAFPTQITDCSNPDSDDPAGHAVLSAECKQLLTNMRKEVGPHNVYNVYDNCPQTTEFLRRVGKDQAWLVRYLRNGIHSPQEAHENLIRMNGGYRWDCLGNVDDWITRQDVRKALHLDSFAPGASKFSYTLSGPASVTLYPELVKKLRVLIYNGDADTCVPVNGNEDWVMELETRGLLEESRPWAPWFTSNKASPAGYTTKYKAADSEMDFAFSTIRLAGHMAPQYQPEAAFVMLKNFLVGENSLRTTVV